MANVQEDLLRLVRLGVIKFYPKMPCVITVHWYFPEPTWIKINTNGAALDCLGVAEGGGIFYNCRGYVKGCFTVSFGEFYVFEVEMLTVMHALEIAERNSWNKLWLESDTLFVVNILSSRSHEMGWRLLARWSKCLYFLALISFQVSHIFLEGTRVVDVLSKHALGLSKKQW